MDKLILRWNMDAKTHTQCQKQWENSFWLIQVFRITAIISSKDIFTYKCINSHFSGNTMTTEKIVERIINHRIRFEQRNLKKEKKEIEAYEALIKAKQNQKAG